MRTTDKIALIDRIGRELQSRFGFDEIDLFLSEYGIGRPQNVGYNSKWVYAKAALRGATDGLLLKIAEELEIPSPSGGPVVRPPANWRETAGFRLFLSHISKDKLIATRLKECLSPHGIAAFVAHEDIHPTLEWQDEIERALRTMDALVAVHTPGFAQSIWTQQEVGFALGRGTKVISFKMGEDPTGFISRRQALARRGRSAEEIATEIDTLLSADPLTSEKLGEAKRALGTAPSDDDVPF